MRRILALAPLALLSLSSCGGDPSDQAIRQAEETVKAELRAPESAKFSDVERCGKSQIVTGKVNAKNMYGGPSGNVSFYVEGVSMTVYPLERDGPFTAQFSSLHDHDDSLLIERCTAALQGKPLPTASDELNGMDMNATDMNAVGNITMNATDLDATDPEEGHISPEGAAIVENEIDRKRAAGEIPPDNAADNYDGNNDAGE